MKNLLYHDKSCKISIPSVKPTIVKAPEDFTANKGEEVTFMCSAEGVPTPKMSWFEDDIKMSAVTTTSGQRITRFDISLFVCVNQEKHRNVLRWSDEEIVDLSYVF